MQVQRIIINLVALALLQGCASGTYSPYSVPHDMPQAALVSGRPLDLPESALVFRHILYRVSGEVANPNHYDYVGRTTLTKAIQSAGGLTTFANRRRVELRRRDGKVEHFNFDRLTRAASEDPEICPGDTIIVKRSLFW